MADGKCQMTEGAGEMAKRKWQMANGKCQMAGDRSQVAPGECAEEQSGETMRELSGRQIEGAARSDGKGRGGRGQPCSDAGTMMLPKKRRTKPILDSRKLMHHKSLNPNRASGRRRTKPIWQRSPRQAWRPIVAGASGIPTD